MSTHSQTYSQSDRDRLLSAAAEVLLATVAADRTGVIGYFREIMAAGRYLYDAQRRYADNALVQELFSYTESGNHAAETKAGNDEVPLTRERLLANLAEVGDLLHDDVEADQFKLFLFELAQRVARASGRPFGPRVTEDEAAFLAELRRLLKMPSAA